MGNKLKTTQGEWKFYQKDHWCEVQREEPLKSICAININVEEHIANGKLIACAPEMFDVLQNFVNAIELEEIIIKENFDNDGHENCGNRLYESVKKVLEKVLS